MLSSPLVLLCVGEILCPCVADVVAPANSESLLASNVRRNRRMQLAESSETFTIVQSLKRQT